MNVSHVELAVAVIWASIASIYFVAKNSGAIGRIDKQMSPNGDDDHRTIRQVLAGLQTQLAEVLHMNNRMADDLRRHDDRARETQAHLIRVERKLDDHLEADQAG